MTTREYSNVHNWIKLMRGTPPACEDCGIDQGAITIDWANISGDYLFDIDDWKRLCRKCHYKFDYDRSMAKQDKNMIDIYGISNMHDIVRIPKEERERLKEEWRQRESKREHHPLNWEDRELRYLIKQGLSPINLYRAMGYEGQVVTEPFKKRLETLTGMTVKRNKRES